jgi:hypothetical protein
MYRDVAMCLGDGKLQIKGGGCLGSLWCFHDPLPGMASSFFDSKYVRFVK